MGFLTFGHLNLTAARVQTDVDITELRDGMRQHRYSGAPPTRGWAALRWRNEQEEAPRLDRTNPGEPAIEDFGEHRVLLARLFIDRENRALRRSVGGRQFDGFAATVRFNVQAVDVAVIKGDGLYVFIASHDPDDVKAVFSALKEAADGNGDWSVGPMPKLEPSSDLYLWMLYRWHDKNGHLTPSLKIVEFRTLSTRDSLGHIIRSLSGIDLTRVDTLGAAAEAHDLGPAKFVVVDTQVGIRADLFFLLNGTFDIHRSGTEYEIGPLDKALLGIYATIDVATRVLPRLHNAHASDKEWRTSTRAKFVDECRQALADRFKAP